MCASSPDSAMAKASAVDALGIVDAPGFRFCGLDEIPLVVLVPVAVVFGRGDAPAGQALGPGDVAGWQDFLHGDLVITAVSQLIAVGERPVVWPGSAWAEPGSGQSL
jgi:hypothetical protein